MITNRLFLVNHSTISFENTLNLFFCLLHSVLQCCLRHLICIEIYNFRFLNIDTFEIYWAPFIGSLVKLKRAYLYYIVPLTKTNVESRTSWLHMFDQLKAWFRYGWLKLIDSWRICREKKSTSITMKYDEKTLSCQYALHIGSTSHKLGEKQNFNYAEWKK